MRRLLALVFVVGCGAKSAPPTAPLPPDGSAATTTTAKPSPGSEAAAQIADFANRACACKDAPCARQVVKDFATWGAAHPGIETTDANVEERARAEGNRLGTCAIKAGLEQDELQKIVQSGAPSPG